MDILWLPNTVSRQFFVNAVATITDQLITINNLVNGVVLGGGDTATTTESDPTNAPTNRSNETLFTKHLINSIRENIGCTHRYGFNGDTDTHLYQPTNQEPPPQYRHQHRSSVQRLQSPKSTTRTIEDIKAIVKLDIEKSGTISMYDCDSNYTAAATTASNILHSNLAAVNDISAPDNVKSDNCNYNKRHRRTGSQRTRTASSAPVLSTDDSTDSTCNTSHLNRVNIDSPINISPISGNTVFHAQFDKHAQLNRGHWWKNLVLVICYLFLLSSSLRICSANKHEGNCHDLLIY